MKISMKSLGGTDPLLRGWMGFLIALIILGIFGAYYVTTRHEAQSIEWGLLVPSYVFFALASTGSSLVNSVFTVFNVKRFKPIIKRGIWLSLILIVPSWIFILLDLGRSEHVLNLYLFFHTSSRLAWMGALYIIFGLSLLLQLIIVIREEHLPKWAPKLLGIVVLAATLAVEANLGGLFGAVMAKPLWSSYSLALYFIVSAMLVGSMIHVLFISVTYVFRKGSVPHELERLFFRDYRPAVIGLIIINFILMAVKYIPEAFSPEATAHVNLLFAGSYSLPFWGIEVVVGGIMPIIILLLPKTKHSITWLIGAAVITVIGVFISKYDLMIAGQSISPLTGSFIPYFPDIWEIFLVLGGAAVCLLLYTVGELLLPLDPEMEPAWFIFTKRKARVLPESNSSQEIIDVEVPSSSQ